MRMLLVIPWLVGVVGVGLCQYPTLWGWVPALLGLLVGSVQAFALPPDRQWRWIAATPVLFGLGSILSLLPAALLGNGYDVRLPITRHGVNGVALVLSWLFSAVVLGAGQRWLYLRWAGAGERQRVTPTRAPPQTPSVGRGWGRRIGWSLALALLLGILVAAVASAELGKPSSETAALGVLFGLLLGAATAVVTLVLALIGFAVHARLKR